MVVRASLIESTALDALVERLFPGSRVKRIARLGEDAAADATTKGFGYGVPLEIVVQDDTGRVHSYVLHTASPNQYGHDRRSDRAQEMLLAYDTFGAIPRHSRAVDVGALSNTGHMLSLAGTTEFYLLTEYARGAVYATDLRRIAASGRVTGADVERCEHLARYLAALHMSPLSLDASPQLYRRAIRDLVGDGEGIFGIIDGYPPSTPSAPPERLAAIEERCVQWRWKLRDRTERLALTHGDFHPFNILFDDDDRLTLLDASRGCRGDPADDVCCLAINYLFFGLAHPRSWRDALGVLWDRFWSVYMSLTADAELFEVAAPFFAWRALVLANPTWYPALTADERDRLLRFAERALDADCFSPTSGKDVFACPARSRG